MKDKWHTWTLFFKGWKYRWSYKYEHCIECWQTNNKHKGHWLCTYCHEKARTDSPIRQRQKKIIRARHYYRYRVDLFLNKPAPIKRWRVKVLTREERLQQQKDWYKRNSPRISLQKQIKTRLKKWLPCMQIVIKGETRYLPFESLEKPSTTTNDNYEQWKEDIENFKILKAYYESK